MLGAKHGFVQSMDCPVQSMDLRFVPAIHGLIHDSAILGLHMHDAIACYLLGQHNNRVCATRLWSKGQDQIIKLQAHIARRPEERMQKYHGG